MARGSGPWAGALACALWLLALLPTKAAATVVRLLGVAPEAGEAEASAAVNLTLERLRSRLLCRGGNNSSECGLELAFHWLPANVDGTRLTDAMKNGNFAAVFSGSRGGPVAQAVALTATVLDVPAFSYAAGLPVKAPYDYFFRTVASDTYLPTIWLHFGSIVTSCLEFALVISEGSSITRSAFEEAAVRFNRTGVQAPVIEEFASVSSHRKPGTRCGQELFWLLAGIRQRNLRFIIAAVDDEALMRCLLCAGNAFHQSANASFGAHIWLTKGNLQSDWWDVDDPALKNSVNRYAGQQVAGKVGDLCNREALRVAARFHISFGPRFEPQDLSTPWGCGTESLGLVRDLTSAAGSAFQQGAAPVADALCATTLVLMAMLRNASTAGLLNVSSLDRSTWSRHFNRLLEDPSIVNFNGAAAQPIVFGSQSRAPMHFVTAIHQLQSTGSDLTTATWRMMPITEWVRYSNGYVGPAASFSVEWPDGEFIVDCLAHRDRTTTTPLPGTRVETVEVRETNMIALGVLIALIGILIIFVLLWMMRGWRRRRRESRSLKQAVEFLKQTRKQMDELTDDPTRLWSCSGSKTTNFVKVESGATSEVRIFCCLDKSACEQEEESGDLFAFSPGLKTLIADALKALCEKQRLNADKVSVCICRAGDMRSGSMRSYEESSSFNTSAPFAAKPSGVSRTRTRAFATATQSFCCCCCRRSQTPVKGIRRASIVPAPAPEQFSSLAFAVDQADFCLVVADRENLHLPSEEGQEPGPSEYWLHGTGEPGRAFVCLAALALKLPEERFVFDGMKLRPLLVGGEDTGGKRAQVAPTLVTGVKQFWPRFKDGLKLAGETSDGTIRAAKVGLLHLWTAAVSHGDSAFVDIVRGRNDIAGIGPVSLDALLARDYRDPLFNLEADLPGIPNSEAIRQQLVFSDKPIYFPLGVPEEVREWLTPAAFDKEPRPQEFHGSRDRAALLAHRRATVSLVRAVNTDYPTPLLFAQGASFEAPNAHPRVRVVLQALKYFDKQLQAHRPPGEPPLTSAGTSTTTVRRSGGAQRAVSVSFIKPRPKSIAKGGASNDMLLADNWVAPEALVPGGGQKPENTSDLWKPRFCGKPLEMTLVQQASEPRNSGFSAFGAKPFGAPGLLGSQFPGAPTQAKCGPTHHQCTDCLSLQRRAEAVLAIRALTPVVCAFLLAFIRAVHAGTELHTLVMKEITREMEFGYRAVYHAVLGLIREEHAYAPLMEAVDSALAAGIAATAGSKPENPSGVVELVLAAHARHRRLQEYCTEVARRVSGVDPSTPASDGTARGGFDLDKVPPPKGCWRILEKSALRPGLYKARAAGSSRDLTEVGGFTGPVSAALTLDAARSTILLNNCEGMLRAVEIITSEASPVRIVRGKNRLKTPTPGGWADVMLNVVWRDDPVGHVMEVQLIHVKLMMIRHSDAFKGHDRYATFRAAMEVAEVLHLDTSMGPP